MWPEKENVQPVAQVMFALPEVAYAVPPAVKAVWPELMQVLGNADEAAVWTGKAKQKVERLKKTKPKPVQNLQQMCKKNALQNLQRAQIAGRKKAMEMGSQSAGWRQCKHLSQAKLEEMALKKADKVVFAEYYVPKLRGGGTENEENADQEDQIRTELLEHYVNIM